MRYKCVYKIIIFSLVDSSSIVPLAVLISLIELVAVAIDSTHPNLANA